jgi:serine/threonine protein kinase/Tol biopolymer transport system component
MPLPTGTRFGPYEVTGAIGAGGMGEVYRARDTKLDRDVAIKVLPESFALDADRIARFTREAKALAALNHPNIAAIYGIEEQGATRALVMELVDGPTLAELIDGRPEAESGSSRLRDSVSAGGRGGGAPRNLSLDDALPIARQIAEALEAAHEQGIVHRDLKPANVKVRPDGTVKVLDFGLAKAVNPDGSSDSASYATMTSPAMTQMGVILGTAAYMSPEQAKGRVVDKRADIWSFGAVLYEMLAGERAFRGGDVTEVLASVIKDKVDLDALPANVPARLKELIGRCLERDPRKRQRDAGDILLELAAIDKHRDEPAPGATKEPSRRPLLAMALVAAAALAIGGAAGAWLRSAPATENASPVRLSMAAPDRGPAWSPQISPDGRVVVFATHGRLYQQSLAGFEAVAIPGTDGADVPMMSPDGRQVAFFAGGELRRVSLTGGNPVRIAEIKPSPGGAWGPNQEILYSQAWSSGLWAVPVAGGGTPRRVTEPDRSKGERGHWRPQFLPDGKRVLFTIMMAGTGVNDCRIAILDVSTGSYRPLFPGTDGLYLRSGHILYFHGGVWRLVPFDLATERATGESTTVLPDAFSQLPDGGGAGMLLSISDNGALVYLPGPTAPQRELVWMDRSGGMQPAGLPAHPITRVSLSPDGRRVAMARIEAGMYEVWVADLARKTEDRLNVKGSNMDPVWDPQSEWLAFISERKGQYDSYIARPDGSGERALLEADHDEAPIAWSRTGRIFVKEWKQDGTLPTVAVDQATGKSSEVIFSGPGVGTLEISRDSRWLLYSSRVSGRPDVYVRAFSADSPALRVSTEPAITPYWSPNGREVFFKSMEALKVASFRGDGPRPEVGVPQTLFNLGSSELCGVGPDGRFLVARLAGPDRPPGVRVVLNWFSEFGAAAPGKY